MFLSVNIEGGPFINGNLSFKRRTVADNKISASTRRGKDAQSGDGSLDNIPRIGLDGVLLFFEITAQNGILGNGRVRLNDLLASIVPTALNEVDRLSRPGLSKGERGKRQSDKYGFCGRHTGLLEKVLTLIIYSRISIMSNILFL